MYGDVHAGANAKSIICSYWIINECTAVLHYFNQPPDGSWMRNPFCERIRSHANSHIIRTLPHYANRFYSSDKKIDFITICVARTHSEHLSLTPHTHIAFGDPENGALNVVAPVRICCTTLAQNVHTVCILQSRMRSPCYHWMDA